MWNIIKKIFGDPYEKKIKECLIELTKNYEKRREMSLSGQKHVKNASPDIANKIIEAIIPK